MASMTSNTPLPSSYKHTQRCLPNEGLLTTPPHLFIGAATFAVKKGCFSASAGLILFSGLSVKQCSSRSTKWFRSLVSASFIPADAAKRRVRRSRVGLTTGRTLAVVCVRMLVSDQLNFSATIFKQKAHHRSIDKKKKEECCNSVARDHRDGLAAEGPSGRGKHFLSTLTNRPDALDPLCRIQGAKTGASRGRQIGGEVGMMRP